MCQSELHLAAFDVKDHIVRGKHIEGTAIPADILATQFRLMRVGNYRGRRVRIRSKSNVKMVENLRVLPVCPRPVPFLKTRFRLCR